MICLLTKMSGFQVVTCNSKHFFVKMFASLLFLPTKFPKMTRFLVAEVLVHPYLIRKLKHFKISFVVPLGETFKVSMLSPTTEGFPVKKGSK